MKDEIPLNEIRLFSRRPDEVGFETLISTIDRLVEMAISRLDEKAEEADHRRALLCITLGIWPVDKPKPHKPIVKAQLKIDPPKAPPPPPPRSVKGEHAR